MFINKSVHYLLHKCVINICSLIKVFIIYCINVIKLILHTYHYHITIISQVEKNKIHEFIVSVMLLKLNY